MPRGVPIDTDRLYRARIRAGLSMAKLAERAGRRHDTLAAIELGRSRPTVETLKALSDVLGVPADSLLCAKEDES